MVKDAKYYLQKSFRMEPKTVLKYLETMLKVIMNKFVLGYLFDSSFQEVYLERGVECYVDFLDEVPSVS
jgi:hypothetical protein